MKFQKSGKFKNPTDLPPFFFTFKLGGNTDSMVNMTSVLFFFEVLDLFIDYK